MGTLGGSVYFMSIFVDFSVKIGVGAFSNQQWLFQLRSLIAFLNMSYFWQQGYILQLHPEHPELMMGWDDDASHSQVICPSEDRESILCPTSSGSVCK